MPGQVIIDRGELAGQAYPATYRISLANEVVSEYARAPSVGAKQGREHANRDRLTGTIRAQHSVHRPGRNSSVDPIDRPSLSERFG